MQTLEQIVEDSLKEYGELFLAYNTFVDNNMPRTAQQTLDKLAKLRKDTIRQVESYINEYIANKE